MVSIVLAGGGSAGHTSPLIATAERLREQDPAVRLTVVGTATGLETRVLPAAVGNDAGIIGAALLGKRKLRK